MEKNDKLFKIIKFNKLWILLEKYSFDKEISTYHGNINF